MLKGKDKVFRWLNGKVVEGPEKGLPFESGSFVYLIEGDTWKEIPMPGHEYHWKRVKDGAKK